VIALAVGVAKPAPKKVSPSLMVFVRLVTTVIAVHSPRPQWTAIPLLVLFVQLVVSAQREPRFLTTASQELSILALAPQVLTLVKLAHLVSIAEVQTELILPVIVVLATTAQVGPALQHSRFLYLAITHLLRLLAKHHVVEVLTILYLRSPNVEIAPKVLSVMKPR
jgi:hypothetical protein